MNFSLQYVPTIHDSIFFFKPCSYQELTWIWVGPHGSILLPQNHSRRRVPDRRPFQPGMNRPAHTFRRSHFLRTFRRSHFPHAFRSSHFLRAFRRRPPRCSENGNCTVHANTPAKLLEIPVRYKFGPKCFSQNQNFSYNFHLWHKYMQKKYVDVDLTIWHIIQSCVAESSKAHYCHLILFESLY